MSQYSTSNLAALQTKEGNLFGTVFRASIEKLIATKLDRFGIEEVDYVLTILDRIAYTAHKQKTYPIDWELIEEQIEEYNKKYKYSYSPTDVVQCLEESRILRHNSDKYEFCQVSYYTFFIARQIKYLWQEKGNNEDFIEALRMAFLPINSSIVLFVTYIMDSEMLINQIKEAAKKSVQEWQLFDPKKPKQNFFGEVDLTRANLIEENSEEGIRRAQDENERDADKQLQRLWQNPYASRDAISKDELVSLSLSLMIISSQLLPNLGHRITGSDKDEFVRLIYEMPLRIFDEWASDIDNDKISIIRDIQQLYVLEYRKAGFRGESISDSKAIEYLRRESISLLLELMDICISNATRRNTYDLIDDFDHKKEIGFELEWLISHEKRSDVQTYIKEIDRINKENKSGLPHVMIQQVAAHYIMNNRSIDGRDIQHLNASIFDGKLPQRIMLLDRQANAKRT